MVGGKPRIEKKKTDFNDNDDTAPAVVIGTEACPLGTMRYTRGAS